MDEEEDFNLIGTPLPPYEDDEAVKAPTAVHDLTVRDAQGRRRFHGAFTGGFSAGYFNSVGSKEGWTPSTFVSSREQRGAVKDVRPEDFMDDEDLGEHGITPRQVVATHQFTHSKRKAQATGVIPGDQVLAELVVPTRDPIGVKLLRYLGWREGLEEHRKSYGCTGPSQQSKPCPDWPQPKGNTHGLGYHGLVPLFAPPTAAAPSLTRKGRGLSGRGQAFGVGAFEVEDEDVYSLDSMSNYDFALEGEKTGKSARALTDRVKVTEGPVEGFHPARSTLDPPRKFPAPDVPQDWGTDRATDAGGEGRTPRHGDRMDVWGRRAALGEIKSVRDLIPSADRDKLPAKPRKRGSRFDQGPRDLAAQDPPDQPAAVTTALPQATPPRLGAPHNAPGHTPQYQTSVEPGALPQHLLPRDVPVSTPPPAHPVTVTSPRRSTPSSSHPPPVTTSTFKPFANEPDKQQRYEAFLQSLKTGQSYVPPADQTDWQRERELEAFSRASRLYRPLTSNMAARFTSATHADDQQDVKLPENKPLTLDTAVAHKQFGRQTHRQHEWHPAPLLCKRFNIQPPYPDSTAVGLLQPIKEPARQPALQQTSQSDKKPALGRPAVVQQGETRQPHTEVQEPVNQWTQVDTTQKPEEENQEPAFSIKARSKVKMTLKPLAILATVDLRPKPKPQATKASSEAIEVVNSSQADVQADADIPEVDSTDDTAPPSPPQPTRPPMDLFKSIFADSDEEAEVSLGRGVADLAGTGASSKVPRPPLLPPLLPPPLPASSGQQKFYGPTLPVALVKQSLAHAPVAAADDQNEPTSSDLYGPELPPDYDPTAVEKKTERKKKKKKKDKKKNKKKKKKDKVIEVSSDDSHLDDDEVIKRLRQLSAAIL